ncbi:MAG: GNAT family N-acetyltransferase [Hyphomicrobiales bacterium]
MSARDATDPRARGSGATPSTLKTARLLLRPFSLADAPEVRRLAGDRANADTTLAIPHPYPEGAAEEWIATHAPRFADGTLANFAVTRAADGVLLGAIGLMIVPDHARAEVGYWIGVPYWGQGVATEAARAVLDYGFDGLGLHRIQAHYLTRNPASGRVLAKIGMRPEGIRRHAIRKWGVFEDLAACALLATDRGAAGPGAG